MKKFTLTQIGMFGDMKYIAAVVTDGQVTMVHDRLFDSTNDFISFAIRFYGPQYKYMTFADIEYYALHEMLERARTQRIASEVEMEFLQE